MQPLILVLILLLAVGVHSGCHTTGEYWDDLPAALAAVDRACIFLTGEYRRRTSRSVCIDRGELRYEFYVGFDERWHWSLVDHFAAYRAIGQAECVDGLRKEVTGCERGGESWYEKWVYRADPNAGHCRDIPLDEYIEEEAQPYSTTQRPIQTDPE